MMRHYLDKIETPPIKEGVTIVAVWLLAFVSFSLAMVAQIVTGLSAFIANSAARLQGKGESVAMVHASGHAVAMFAVGIALADASKAVSSEVVAPDENQVDEGGTGNAVDDVPASTSAQSVSETKDGDDSEEHS